VALFDSAPRPWSELVEAASRAGTGVGLADLRWTDHPTRPLTSVMVLAWHEAGGIVEVTPADGGPAGSVCCTTRHPLEVWTGLTGLAARAVAATARTAEPETLPSP
jgi:hypothetical protein